MDINIFLMCFNESALLPHTIKHYKTYLPSCKITIYDNESTDDSVKIAKSLGCSVISWNSNNILDEFKIRNIKNNSWKFITKGWIIMADMDEFLCITEDDLIKEMNLGTSILNVIGYDMVGESKTIDLSDIDLQNIKKYIDNHNESKKLCFLRENIQEMNYDCGAHSCNPTGTNIIYSSTTYINKHMSSLGLIFLKNKYIERYKRTFDMRKYRMSIHYTDDIVKIENMYNNMYNNCKLQD
jgi:hypothetical protein